MFLIHLISLTHSWFSYHQTSEAEAQAQAQAQRSNTKLSRHTNEQVQYTSHFSLFPIYPPSSVNPPNNHFNALKIHSIQRLFSGLSLSLIFQILEIIIIEIG